MKNDFYEHSKIIYKYNEELTIENYQEILSKLYKYVKKITPYYFKDGVINPNYEEIKLDIMLTEERVKFLKIIDVPIYYNYLDEPSGLIESIVFKAREYLLNEHNFCGYKKGLLDIDFTEDCKKASEYVKLLCDKEKLDCTIIELTPGFDSKYNLFDGSGKHYANILDYNNEYYLIDVTYSQFFYSRRNNIDRIGIYDLSGCAPGIFMLMNEERKKLAINLIQDGYVKLNDIDFKNYMDGFALSYRNGSYYEKTSDYSYTTDYTVNNYIDFLSGKDSQVNHEGECNLGFQKKIIRFKG